MIALHSRTYLDVEVTAPLETLREGKGKVDRVPRVAIGGFACNAARAMCALHPGLEVRVVTLASPMDRDRFRASLPARVGLDLLAGESGGEPGEAAPPWPAISVILNPAAQCRILRDPLEHTDDAWRVEAVPARAMTATLHVLGRLPAHYVQGVLSRSRASRSRVAWCGGDALGPGLERRVDLLCVNAGEASRLLGGGDRSPLESARELLERAHPPDAVRVVTGRGAAPPALAHRSAQGETLSHEASGHRVEPGEIRTLFRAGDVFAAALLARLTGSDTDPAAALEAAHSATTRFIRGDLDLDLDRGLAPTP